MPKPSTGGLTGWRIPEFGSGTTQDAATSAKPALTSERRRKDLIRSSNRKPPGESDAILRQNWFAGSRYRWRIIGDPSAALGVVSGVDVAGEICACHGTTALGVVSLYQ